jgi:SHS2 domain-containing protein
MIQENSKSGYLELAHTADWALKVWAPDLVRLFIEAAAGMYMLMEVQLEHEPRSSVPLDLQAFDDESLLVAFLVNCCTWVKNRGWLLMNLISLR